MTLLGSVTKKKMSVQSRSMLEGVGGRWRLLLATKSLIVMLRKSFAKSVIGDGRGYSQCQSTQ